MRHGNIDCCVLVDGQPLTEYDVKQEGGTVSCWIVADAGKAYAVKVTPAVRQPNHSARLHIDGVEKPVYRHLLGKPQTMHHLSFGNLSPSQPESEDEDSPGRNLSELSTIRLDVWLVERRGKYEKRREEYSCGQVSERAISKKAGRVCDVSTKYVPQVTSFIASLVIHLRTSKESTDPTGSGRPSLVRGRRERFLW